MKSIIFQFLMAFGLFLTTASAGDDKQAIKETISGEINAFVERDFESWSKFWIHEPYASSTFINSLFMESTESWDSISAGVKEYMESEEEPTRITLGDDFNILVMGDVATAKVSSEETMFLFGEDKTFERKSEYLLKKENGSWKIVSLTDVYTGTFNYTEFNNEFEINWQGYQLMRNGRVDDAIKVFQLNTELYPQASNTWDSLAEGYMTKGDNAMAVKYYRKSLELDPMNENAKAMIEKMNE